MKAPVIPIDAALPPAFTANKITEIGLAPTSQVSIADEPLYSVSLGVSIHESNSGTGQRESMKTSLRGGPQTLSRAAAELAILTMPGKKMRFSPALKLKSQPAMDFFLRVPSSGVDDDDAELRKRDREIDEAIRRLAIPKLEKLIMTSHKLLTEYPILAEDPDRLANAANGHLTAKAERDELESVMPRSEVAPRLRPAPRM